MFHSRDFLQVNEIKNSCNTITCKIMTKYCKLLGWYIKNFFVSNHLTKDYSDIGNEFTNWQSPIHICLHCGDSLPGVNSLSALIPYQHFAFYLD